MARRVVIHALLLTGAAASLVPFAWMVSTSLKPQGVVFTYPPQWVPDPLTWTNYLTAWTSMPFWRFFSNTARIAVLIVAGQLFTCSLAGYAFARLRFPGRDALFVLYLATMMIPLQVTIIPTFVVMRHLGWINTHLAIVVPQLAGAFGTFLLRQWYLSMPRDLEDAARIDGCSPFGTYWRIFLPLSRPALATLAVFTFMHAWNDFLWPLIVISSEGKRTLTVGLAYFIRQHTTDWTALMAGSVTSLLPIIVLFLAAQRYFVRGVTLTGLKF